MIRTEKSILLRGGATVALCAMLSLPLPVTAQEAANGEDQTEGATAEAGEAGAETEDRVVVTVSEAEIRDSDIMDVIGALPPALQEQPLDALIPVAVDHLVLRELILEQARSENLGENEEVKSLARSLAPKTEEDAMVQFWINREIEGRVSDENVQQVYDALSAESGEDAPTLDEARSQIRQQLGQEALREIRASLMSGSEIVFYGPDGEPLDEVEAPAAN